MTRSADRHRKNPGSGWAGGPQGPLLLGLALVLIALAGCSELKKYWNRSPTGPQVSRDLTPPAVRVVSPAGPDSAHATPVTGADYRVVIEASDDVAVARVLLHVDDGPAVEVSGPPWELDWDTTALAEGVVHRLWAEAFDGAGNRSVSDTIYAQAFNSGPGVALVEPDDGALVLGTIAVVAEIEGSPEIERVELNAGAIPIATLTAPPWTFSLDTALLPAGDHYLIARVLTRLGHEGVSPPLRIRVNNGAPSVAIDFPLDGHRVATRGTLILSGAALDGVEGAIPADRFTWVSSLDGPIGAGPYFRKRFLSVGTHLITAHAVNAWGTPSSASIQVEVLARPTYAFCRDIYTTIFRGYCLSCHQPGTTEFPDSQLDLKSYAGTMAGGITHDYQSVVPCKPDSSLIWNKLTAEVPWVGAPMPPRDRFMPLTPANLAKIRTWILEGAAPDDPEICPY